MESVLYHFFKYSYCNPNENGLETGLEFSGQISHIYGVVRNFLPVEAGTLVGPDSLGPKFHCEIINIVIIQCFMLWPIID